MEVKNDLPEHLFANPVWHALQTQHRHFAQAAGHACRYPADVTPFAAVSSPDIAALQQLRSLLEPGESVWLIGETYPSVPGLSFSGTLPCLQMVLSEPVLTPAPEADIQRLTDANAAGMVALTDVAFPGFFRRRTCEMGPYYGVRSHGELIAMGGTRLTLDGYPEISGICTHPAHRGKGLAASLIAQLAQDHRRAGLVSWLQVGIENHHAIELYLRVGFRPFRQVTLHRISRIG
jgi:ribosomal protein S18 acetylase RimI-like enzyme